MLRIKFKSTFLLIICSILFSFTSCDKDDPSVGLPMVDSSADPLPNLSDYQFFVGDLANLDPNEHVIPYDLNTPLFSDYAGKARFIYVPPGSKIEYTSGEVLNFPVGSVIIKTFYFDFDLRDPSVGRKIMETRLLIHQATGWFPATYVWNDEQTEATFSVVGKQEDVEWIHYDGSIRGTRYLVPNKNSCKGCHSLDNEMVLIGPKSRNLNKTYTYETGTENQLIHWQTIGILANAPELAAIPKVPVWNEPSTGSLNDRARAYLDINCAHCHNPAGPGDNTGLNLTYGVTNPVEYGVCKSPVAAGGGSGGREYSIVPGDPDASIVVYRMNSTEIDVAMPELARSVIHTEGLDLITEWISSLEGDCD